MKSRNIRLYEVTLLNGEHVIIKNNTGEKLLRLREKEYIRDFKPIAEIQRGDITKANVAYDLDKIRSLRDMHRLLVTDIYLSEAVQSL